MKIKIVSTAVILTAAAALLTFSACKKDQTPSNDLSSLGTNTPADYSMVTNESGNVDAMVEPAASGIMTFGFRWPIPSAWRFGRFNIGDLGPCATISFDTSGSSRSMTINYGTTGCQCWDGKTRSGEVMMSWTGPRVDSGNSFMINTSNYWVNSNKVAIHKVVTNGGLNSSGEPFFNVSENDSLTLDTTNQVITLTASRVRTWTGGFDTPQLLDDQYSITGSGNGIDRDGNAFSYNISNPLILHMDCPWIEAGTIDYTLPKFSQLSLDFGDGTCDNIATVDVNGTTHMIHLRW